MIRERGKSVKSAMDTVITLLAALGYFPENTIELGTIPPGVIAGLWSVDGKIHVAMKDGTELSFDVEAEFKKWKEKQPKSPTFHILEDGINKSPLKAGSMSSGGACL